MSKRFRIAVVTAFCSLAMLLCPVVAWADVVLEVTPTTQDAFLEVQLALNKAKKYATASEPYVVKVAPGSYTLTHSLRAYSNTTLDMTDCSFTLMNSSNMVKVGDVDDTQTGYYYQNINIIGGTLDHNGRSTTCIKIAHAKNVTVQGVSLKNAKDGHLMEVAGVAYLTVDKCSFSDQTQSLTTGIAIPEALQIDVLNQKHMPYYRSEDLPSKNITITNCTFTNVPRGIGGHTAVLNSYTKNVVIKGNTFTNLKSDAIRLMNVYNCAVQNNVINGAPRGISIYMNGAKGVYLGSSLAKEGLVPSTTLTTYKAPSAKQLVTIKNNTITVKGSDIYGNPTEAVLLCGFKCNYKMVKTVETDVLPQGNYYVSGATVSGNKITTTGHGIRLSDARNSLIKGNTIAYNGSATTATKYHGIYLCNASVKNIISTNTVSNMRGNGIVLTGSSSATYIKANKITSCGAYGISVQGSSTPAISQNTISKSGSASISVLLKGSVTRIYKNTITSSKSYGVSVDDSTVVAVRSNKITSPRKAGILLAAKSKVTRVIANTIKSGSSIGIAVKVPGRALSIKSNKVASCKSYAIWLKGGSSTYRMTVRSNKLTGTASRAGVKVISGKATISGSKKL